MVGRNRWVHLSFEINVGHFVPPQLLVFVKLEDTGTPSTV